MITTLNLTYRAVMLPEMLTQSSVDGYSADVVGIYLTHLLE
jgi:hypothetical protein